MVDITTKWEERLKKSKERLEICGSCEHLQELVYMCKQCGCMMKIKTMFPSSKCPIGKWGKYIEDEN